jgi:sporulation protein YlmC with PRC-barrel domain
MLHRVRALKGDPIIAEDGDLGSVDDFYFDARAWGVRFLVVATGPWGIGRKVMISPSAVERSSPDARMRVRMTREEVEKNPEVQHNPEVSSSDPGGSHLLSSAELVGYSLEAPDGEIGHVEDFLVDDESWAIADMVVDTRKWFPGGKRVLVPPTAVAAIDRPAKKVRVRLTRDEVRNSPEAGSR